MNILGIEFDKKSSAHIFHYNLKGSCYSIVLTRDPCDTNPWYADIFKAGQPPSVAIYCRTSAEEAVYNCVQWLERDFKIYQPELYQKVMYNYVIKDILE